jgi:hypothetical protein
LLHPGRDVLRPSLLDDRLDPYRVH